MYERFTELARQTMQLAQQESQRLNHDYNGTEHQLLGLIKLGRGVAHTVLTKLDVDLRKVRLEVEKLVLSGPTMVTLGKLPLTPRAKKVIEFAMEEARNMSNNFVDEGHLLLGLLREPEGVAAQVLTNLGVSFDAARKEVLDIFKASIQNIQTADPVVAIRKDEIEQWCIDKISKLPNVKDVFGQIIITGELNATARFVIDALSDIECERSAHILDFIQAERFRQFNAKYGKK